MPQPGLIIVDDIPSYRRVALIRAGRLDQIWFDDATRHPYQTGALVAVRITQHFAQHNRATVTLDGIPASLRLADHHQHKPGAMIAATIVSDARDDGFGHKPLQLKAAENTAPEDIPATPGLMAAAPDAMARALATAPDAHIHHDQDGALWAAHDLDDQLTAAQTPFLDLPGGGRLAITTPPGAAVIDGDSATSRLAPLALAEHMVPTLMRQLRLRRIGGPIVIDFPRLDAKGQHTIHALIKAEAKNDPHKPSLHGFTRGGLYTMARPWRDRMLAEEALPHGRHLGLAVLRMVKAHQHNLTPGELVVRLHNDGVDWLGHDGAEIFNQMKAELAFQVKLISDNNTAVPQRDG